jgi:hypothetical protein
MTAKLAAAMSAIRNITTVLTTRVVIVATRLSGTLPLEATIRPVSPGGRNDSTRDSLAFTIIYTLVTVVVELVLGTLIALVLERLTAGRFTPSGEVDRRADLGAERRGDPVRHRDLRYRRSDSARATSRGGRTVRSDPGSVVDLVDRARHEDVAVADRIDGAEPVLRRRASSSTSRPGCSKRKK